MLAGSHAGQELNYLLSVGSEGAASAISSDAQSGNRRPTVDVPDGLSAHKSAAALQADSHMKHVDVYVKPSSVIIFAAFRFEPQLQPRFGLLSATGTLGAAEQAASWAGSISFPWFCTIVAVSGYCLSANILNPLPPHCVHIHLSHSCSAEEAKMHPTSPRSPKRLQRPYHSLQPLSNAPQGHTSPRWTGCEDGLLRQESHACFD